jgi:hypothetical protein
MVDELMPGRDMAIFSLCHHVIRYSEKKTRHEAEILDEIQTKVLRVFLLPIQSHLYSFALRFLLLQTHATFYIFLHTHATSYIFLQFTDNNYCLLSPSEPIQFDNAQTCFMGERAAMPLLIVRERVL